MQPVLAVLIDINDNLGNLINQFEMQRFLQDSQAAIHMEGHVFLLLIIKISRFRHISLN